MPSNRTPETELVIHPSATNTGTDCHQGKNTPGHKVALAQPLALAAGVSSSRLSGELFVRGMRRLQSAGAQLFAVFGRFHQVKVWLTVTSGSASTDPCRALPATWASPSCPLWLRGDSTVWQTPASQPLQSWGLLGYKRDMNWSGSCGSAVQWHLAAESLLSYFWLFASPNEEPDVSSSLWWRDTATVVRRELDCQAKPVSVGNVHKIISVQVAAVANLYMPGSGLLLGLGPWIVQSVRNGLNHQFYPETEFSFLDMVKK